MVPPPGYGLNDIIVIVKLARDVYRRCKHSFVRIRNISSKVIISCIAPGRDSPGQYRALSAETKQLASILQDVEDMVRGKRLSPEKSEELLRHGQDIKELLLELEGYLRKYESLGVQSRATFDRLKWDEHVAESLRARISTRVTMMNNFYLGVVASGQYKIQQAMDEIVRDLRSGRRGVNSVSSITTQSSCREDDPAWQSIVADLEVQGISREIVKEYDDLVVQRIIEVVQEHTKARLEEPEVLSDNLNLLTISAADDLSKQDSGIGNPSDPVRIPGLNVNLLTQQELHTNARLIADDWNSNSFDSAVETIGYLLDRPAAPECQNSQILLRLMRAIHLSRTGVHNEAFRDLSSIFTTAVDRYTLRPQIRDLDECALFVSAAAWLGCNGLYRTRPGDALVAWGWALIAVSEHAQKDPQISLAIQDRLIRHFSYLKVFLEDSGREEDHDSSSLFHASAFTSAELRDSFLAYAGRDPTASATFVEDVLQDTRIASSDKTPKLAQTTAGDPSVPISLLKWVNPRKLLSSSLRFDDCFCVAGALAHVKAMVSPLTFALDTLPKANLLKTMRLHFASQNELADVVAEAQDAINSLKLLRRIVVIGSVVSIATRWHLDRKDSQSPAVVTTGVLYADLFQVKGKRSKERAKGWGLCFKPQYHVSRWPAHTGGRASNVVDTAMYATSLKLRGQAENVLLAADKRVTQHREQRDAV